MASEATDHTDICELTGLAYVMSLYCDISVVL